WYEIPIMAYKRLSRLQSSSSWVLKDIVSSAWFKAELTRIERLLPHHDNNQRRLLSDLECIQNFKGQTNFAVAGGLVDRHLHGNSWFSGSMFISYLRMRACTIGASGHEAEPALCPFDCPGAIATLKHILNECDHMEGMYHYRHNRAQNTIVDHLVSTGWSVYVNLRVVAMVDNRWCIFVPDIVAV